MSEERAVQAIGDGRAEREESAVGTLTKKDFTSDQEVRWCPGCGDYAILAAVQGYFPRSEERRVGKECRL